MACIYVLISEKTKKFYIGSSRENNADLRFMAHNAGRTRSTKAGRPWRLVFEESCTDYTAARQRENFFKTGQGRRLLKERFGILSRNDDS